MTASRRWCRRCRVASNRGRNGRGCSLWDCRSVPTRLRPRRRRAPCGRPVPASVPSHRRRRRRHNGRRRDRRPDRPARCSPRLRASRTGYLAIAHAQSSRVRQLKVQNKFNKLVFIIIIINKYVTATVVKFTEIF